MAKIEVEQRGLISRDRFFELKDFFTQNGSMIDTKKRFSMIVNNVATTVREAKDELIDIKLRITNKKPELAVKYGKWSGKDSRQEFNFFLEEDQFDDMLAFLKIIGYEKYVLMANTKYDYLYNDIEFSLVEVPNWGYYFEAEISTEPDNIDSAMKKIDKELNDLKLKTLNEEDFYDLLDELNGRDGYKIDLKKTSFSKLKEKFSDYF